MGGRGVLGIQNWGGGGGGGAGEGAEFLLYILPKVLAPGFPISIWRGTTKIKKTHTY